MKIESVKIFLTYLSRRNMQKSTKIASPFISLKKPIFDKFENFFKNTKLLDCETCELINNTDSQLFYFKVKNLKHVFLMIEEIEENEKGDCFGLSFTTKSFNDKHQSYPSIKVNAQVALKSFDLTNTPVNTTNQILETRWHNESPVTSTNRFCDKKEIFKSHFIFMVLKKDILRNKINEIDRVMKSLGIEYENERNIMVKGCLFRLIIENLFKQIFYYKTNRYR